MTQCDEEEIAVRFPDSTVGTVRNVAKRLGLLLRPTFFEMRCDYSRSFSRTCVESPVFPEANQDPASEKQVGLYPPMPQYNILMECDV